MGLGKMRQATQRRGVEAAQHWRAKRDLDPIIVCNLFGEIDDNPKIFVH